MRPGMTSVDDLISTAVEVTLGIASLAATASMMTTLIAVLIRTEDDIRAVRGPMKIGTMTGTMTTVDTLTHRVEVHLEAIPATGDLGIAETALAPITEEAILTASQAPMTIVSIASTARGTAKMATLVVPGRLEIPIYLQVGINRMTAYSS